MIARDRCEICGVFSKVGFTDCGLICESCFNKELQISAYNYAIEECVKTLEGMAERLTVKDGIYAIKTLKKQEHKKVVKETL